MDVNFDDVVVVEMEMIEVVVDVVVQFDVGEDEELVMFDVVVVMFVLEIVVDELVSDVE